MSDICIPTMVVSREIVTQLTAPDLSNNDRRSIAATHSSKAQAIWAAMQRLGNSADTGAIIADLEKRGIVVAAAQVASVRARTARLENR